VAPKRLFVPVDPETLERLSNLRLIYPIVSSGKLNAAAFRQGVESMLRSVPSGAAQLAPAVGV